MLLGAEGHEASDPPSEFDDPGIDTILVWLAAAVARVHDPVEHVSPCVIWAHQRTTTVILTGISPALFQACTQHVRGHPAAIGTLTSALTVGQIRN